MTTVLGLHGFSAASKRVMHDTGVTLVRDGHVVAAINEERLPRKKNDGSFPRRALDTVLQMTRVGPEDIDLVAMPDERPLWQMAMVLNFAMKTYRESGVAVLRYVLDSLRRTTDLRRMVPDALQGKPVKFVEHHLCHAASAYYTSPWSDCTVVTLDGMGDFCIGGMICRGRGGRVDLLHRTNGFYSPGIFYMIVTDLLGFTPGRHEGKITGMAALGDPTRAYPTMEAFLSYRPERLDFLSTAIPTAMDRYSFVRGRDAALDAFRDAWAPFRREDIAAAAQQRFEDVVVPFVRDAVRLAGGRRVALAGGVFANVSLNRRIMELPEVDNVFIHPNMTDGGLSVGAALQAYHAQASPKNGYTPAPMQDVLLGPGWSKEELRQALETAGLPHELRQDIPKDIAGAILAGKVVGHFDGRMEYGPRALGNRSILVSPADSTINQRLNDRLRRTEFMPFAPVIQEENAARCLQGWVEDHVAARFMTITYKVTDEFRDLCPAAVHLDGTARPQVVRRQDNPRLWEIVKEHWRLTGLPAVINTSFNMHEEPIVCSPEDAIRAFNAGAVDILAMGPYWVTR